ncbi:MAG: MATE family efflux transporter [Clostridiales bacterium]|nr:MATE family efflux transporter [Clostridiales bacterium]
MKIQLSEHFTYKKLFRFVLPTIIMMVFTSIYGVVDGLFISNFVGKTPFAAINLIMPFIMILGGMGFMIGTGGTALVSKIVGEGDKEKANKTFTMVIIFAVIFGALLTALGMSIVRPIAHLFGATDDMMEHCVLYGRILIGFTVFFMLQNIFQSFLAAAEKPNLGLIVTLIAGCANIVLDALFIVAFKWGVAGAAVATGIGQILGGVIPLIYFARPNGSLLKLVKTNMRVKPLLKVCGNGSSELLTNVATSIVSIIYNLQLLKYLGENGVSAYGVLMYVQFIFIAIEIGFTIGSAPIVSYNYGAKNDAELKNVFKKSVIVLSITGVVLSGLAQALAVPLGKLFVGYDEELYELTVYAFRLFSFAFIFSGINIYSSGFFTALNNGLISAVLSFLRAVVFQIAFVYVLPLLLGVDGIWWAMFATEICAFIVAVSFFIAKRKKYNYA